MKVEMLSGERKHLETMLGGAVPPAVERLFLSVRRNLLTINRTIPLDVEHLAIIAALAQMGVAPDEAPVHETNGQDEVKLVAAQTNDPIPGEYTGVRAKFENPFPDVKPDTPTNQLPKGFPVMVTKDGVLTVGKVLSFSEDGAKVYLQIPGKKGRFVFPVSEVTPENFEPPSTHPRSVQI